MAGFAFNARTSIAGGTQRLARAMVEASKPKLIRAAEATGEDSVGRILGIIGTTYGQRKGKARSEPLFSYDAYIYKINPSARGVELVFSVKGDDAFMKKFGSLNYGSVAHTISPRGGPLANKADTSKRPKGFFSKTAVIHPGTAGSGFWERGIEQALGGFVSRL